MSEKIQAWRRFIRTISLFTWLQVVVGLIGLAGIALSSWQVWQETNQVSCFELPAPPSIQTEGSLEAANDSPDYVTVYVAGAVSKPGLVVIEAQSRLADAVQAAGGFSEHADQVQLAADFNLAAPVSDGQHIFIPEQGQSVPKDQSATSIVLVSINNATQDELDTLPSIGPARAEAIVAARPYHSIDDLLTKNVVGEQIFYEIQDKITL